MREPDLRRVLLVKAIEESDPDGTLVPAADRLAASKEAKREVAPPDTLRLEQGALPRHAQRLLTARARILLAQLHARHPFVDEIARFSPGPWLAGVLCAIAFALGVGLSALDGTRRINVLAFPLWGVVTWNLAVYVFVAFAFARSLARTPRRGRWLPGWIAQMVMGRVSATIARARRFHAPLARALARFVAEWQEAARPLLAARAAALFHLAAAALGAGLIAGFYLRGIALDYQAGWESTFLDAQQARALLGVLYAPASWITGIAIPDAAHLQAIRWREGAGGEPAARWIHLLAATALAFVVVPRIMLAALAGASAWRRSAHAALPASTAPYFARAFRDVGVGIAGAGVRVIPYAYEPSREAIERLRAQFPDAAVEARATIAYGCEDAVTAIVAEGESPALVALLFTLAATPEEEGHGRVLAAVRSATHARGARIEAIVDEGPYVTRMGEALEARVEERRRAWRSLVGAHGVEARFVDLSR